MSDSLLQKSCKFLEEIKPLKKTKKTEKQKRLKKKKNSNLKQLLEKEAELVILENLKKFKKLNDKCAVDVSEKVVSKCCGQTEKHSERLESDERTVFTDKDFEDFEREYFDS